MRRVISQKKQGRQKRSIFFTLIGCSLFLLTMCFGVPQTQKAIQSTLYQEHAEPQVTSPRVAAAVDSHYIGSIGSLDVKDPRVIAVNASGYYYIGDDRGYYIRVYSPSWEFVLQWGGSGSLDGQLNSPRGIVINSTGHVYVTDFNNDRVQVFTATGQFIRKWGQTGSQPGNFTNPWGIAINASGHVYVTDEGNKRVQVFSQTGNFVATFGTDGLGNGDFKQPHGIAINSTGHVFVCDTTNNDLQIFTMTGNFLRQIAGINQAMGVAVNSTNFVHICGFAENQLRIFAPDETEITPITEEFAGFYGWSIGINSLNNHKLVIQQNQSNGDIFRIMDYFPGGTLSRYCTNPSWPGSLWNPTDVVINGTGYVYVTEGENCRVQVFYPNGTFLRMWGSPGSSPGQFQTPNSIAINATGHVFVVDNVNNRVQVFTSTGQWIASWNKTTGGSGAGDGEFDFPTCIAINSTGAVYVSDVNNHRVQVFSPTGIFLNKWTPEDNSFNQIAINASGSVYITEGSFRVEVYTATGGYLHGWGAYGDTDGFFTNLNSIAVNNSGAAFVNDATGRIQVFDQLGTFIGKWGATGWGPENFSAPMGMQIFRQHVFVTDSGNDLIKIYGNTLPQAQGITISPAGAVAGNALTLAYTYIDENGDPEVSREIRWYKNDVQQGAYDQLTTVPGSAIVSGDTWKATVVVNDGWENSALSSSAKITIGGTNTGPDTTVTTVLLIVEYSVFGAVFVVFCYFEVVKPRLKNRRKTQPL